MLSYEEVVVMLALLVRGGQISESDRDLLLAKWSAAQWRPYIIPVISGVSFPREKTIDNYWRELMGLLDLPANQQEIEVSIDVRNLLADEYERRIDSVFDDYWPRVGRWAVPMRTALEANLIFQIMAGLGRKPTEDELDYLYSPVVMVQAAYLERFVDEIQARMGLGREVHYGTILHRAHLYAGAGLSLWHAADEYAAQQRGEDVNYVEDYIALDDPYTCTPCLIAELQGPYLVGQGPRPGEVCLGRGSCRCQRVRRYDPKAYNDIVAEETGLPSSPDPSQTLYA